MALASLSICLIVLLSVTAQALAADEPYSPYGGGGVHGQILGFNLFDELIPVVWADVSAYRDGELVARAYSMGGGYYEMFLPVGWYTLVVEEPGYKTYSREIFVSSGSSTAINVILELSREPIHKPQPKPPATYTYQVGISGLPATIKTPLYIDGAASEELAGGETVTLTFQVGTSHKLSVRERIERERERYVTTEPSTVASTSGAHEFKYAAEYFLESAVEPAGLSLPAQMPAGWYTAGTTIRTPAVPSLIEGPSGVRYRFNTWVLDCCERSSGPLEFTMDRPHLLRAVYSTEYLVKVSSPHGTPQGAGWYAAGSTATITIEHSEGFLLRRVFVRWSGDYFGRDPTATFAVNRPMHIVAVWTTDYTPAIVLVAAVAVCLAAAGVVLSRRRPTRTPQGMSQS